ncbi:MULTISPECIES: SRPBCC family protein [Pseudoalteromonas]|uniref:Polyketide cyclase n=1 Tax=Pseudoalteromonas amylolytica TaxID=1859457 RepID=A0A1S1MQQ1_9GAMM|nr:MULTISPECIES: SRPBCC family protein [Pseudoalteromonas]OHU86742.1 polyketide cyclase [Pseudoalteromonas sp. JW3]OHU88733.1 polyketide cyclase [Pseudoalteromonas amylolytica]
MFKKIIIILLLIIASPFILALFVADSYHVEREVEIEQPLEQVFSYIKLLKNQSNYSTWAQMDPAMEAEYRGEDGTVGFVSAWRSKHPEVGVGEQEIIKIDENKRIDFELRFKEPFQSTDPAYMITESTLNGTKVKWGFNGHMDYPMNLMLLLMDFEQMLGDDLQVGLDNLKEVLEHPVE